MPLENYANHHMKARGLWRISEDEETLMTLCSEEPVPPAITNQKKRLEFYAARILLKNLLAGWGLPYFGIMKDKYGKPFFREHTIELSLSHSFPYVAAIISRSGSVGIDLEQPKEKLLRIAPRILHPDELADAGSQIVKHCIYWCGKETLIKFHGKKDLTLSENLLITPFTLQKDGILNGRIVADDIVNIPLQYEVYDNFVLVYTL
jgi:4'-phosphopantetheinyl transferase